MREIKFRAWDKSLNRMWNWTKAKRLSTYFADKKETLINPLDNFIGEDIRFDLMQFTGLLDRHGKEIWEGDVVKDEQGDVGKIIFHDAEFFADFDMGWDSLRKIECEVIGNIYENPELLE